jgi:hypothetical protein
MVVGDGCVTGQHSTAGRAPDRFTFYEDRSGFSETDPRRDGRPSKHPSRNRRRTRRRRSRDQMLEALRTTCLRGLTMIDLTGGATWRRAVGRRLPRASDVVNWILPWRGRERVGEVGGSDGAAKRRGLRRAARRRGRGKPTILLAPEAIVPGRTTILPDQTTILSV